MAAKNQRQQLSTRRKHVPQRTCVVCRRKTDKRDLTRLVRPPAGADEDTKTSVVLVDPTGKQAGRGAYLCSRPECWDRALHTSILDKALKTNLSAEARASLAAFQPAPATPVEKPDK